MSDANKLLLRRWFEQVWNQKSEAAIDEMFHPQGKSHGFPDADTVLVGPEPFKAVHRTFCPARARDRVVHDIVLAVRREAWGVERGAWSVRLRARAS